MNQQQSEFRNNKIWIRALIESVRKLNPVAMAANPVMFVVEAGTCLVLLMLLFPHIFGTQHKLGYISTIFFILLFTLLFANFAEALAEGRGKAQAEHLKKAQKDTIASRIRKDGTIEMVSSTELRRNDIVLVSAGEQIPSDGDIVAGTAAIDESAITGESTPVVKQAGSDACSVIGGTLVVSDWIHVRITAGPGETFLDQMIALVEGANRQKSPNEVALNTVLVVFTIVFFIVVLTLVPLASYVGIAIETSSLVALLVCLIPTTIGGLLSAIGIAGMDRVTRYNVMALSGKAVEAAGDIDTIILDKTGTITYGNRMAERACPVQGVSNDELLRAAAASSIGDETPEGKSILTLATNQQLRWDEQQFASCTLVPFSAETRMSGLVTQTGDCYYKGAFEEICNYIRSQDGIIPQDAVTIRDEIAAMGGTPLAICKNNGLLGLIYFKDTVKPGLREKFAQLRQLGIKIMMCTGDNPLTAATIAKEAGVDEYIAECKPEDKIRIIREEQSQGKMVAMTGDGTNDAPALAQADVGIAMNSGTAAAKEAANMIDLDSDPAKLIQVIFIGKQLLMTRGALTTFSIANDFSKYFAIIPSIASTVIPEMQALNIMNLHSSDSAILSALIFNALIIPVLIPLAVKGVKYVPMSANKLLKRNLLYFGLGGIFIPFFGIKAVDMVIEWLL